VFKETYTTAGRRKKMINTKDVPLVETTPERITDSFLFRKLGMGCPENSVHR
jgi:hypothetical protein